MNDSIVRAALLFAALFATICMPTHAAPPQTSADRSSFITAADLLRLRTVVGLDLAPDASFLVYAVRSLHASGPDSGEKRPKYDSRTHLYRLDLDRPDADPIQLTFGDRDDADPQISPDGTLLAFVRKPSKKSGSSGADDADSQPKPQVWILPMDQPGEARQATSLKEGAAAPRWRPDSEAVLVASDVHWTELEGEPHFPAERPSRDWRDTDITAPGADPEHIDACPDGDREAIRNWLARNAAAADPIVHTRLDFQEELGLKKDLKFSQLFLIDLEDEDAEPTRLTGAFRNHRDPQWRADGGQIVYVAEADDRRHPDRVRRTSIYRMNPDGSDPRIWLNDSGLIIDSPRYNETGALLLFRATEFEDRIYKQARLGAVQVSSSHLGWLTEDWDSHANNPGWIGNDRIGFVSPRAGADQLIEGPVGSGGLDRFDAHTAEDNTVLDWDEEQGVIAVAMATPANPAEIHIMRRGESEPERLTSINADWLAEKTISQPTEHWIERPGGERIQYWVMPPANFEPGESYPVVLEIHGGPMAMWGPAEPTMWHEWQLLCAWGYGVVFSNPRGSSGYGFEFQKGNHRNWGEGPTGDVLACLDQALADNEWMDRDRQFVTGGSYAGYLTAWIVAHTDRFKAAVAQRGVYELNTFFGEGNAWRLAPEAFGGFPWDEEATDVYKGESPFWYAENITTPLLIMHGSNDLRTGVSQSEMMYRALKELERPVEYVRYPDAGHDLSRTGNPGQRMDRLLRIVEFFERFADNDAPAPGASSSDDD